MQSIFRRRCIFTAMKTKRNERKPETIKKTSLRIQRGLKRGAEWARTTDSRIFSPMLYQLSYSTISVLVGAKVAIK